MAAPGSVAYNADFNANTTQGQQSLRDYQTQIKAVRAEIAQATKDARDQYQQQMLAARASGASSEALTKIQQSYAQSQIAIKNTQKQLTDSILQGNYSALESEKALDLVRQQAIATLEKETIAAQQLAQAHGHTISNQSAASGTVQFIEGRAGIRTVENFLGNTLGLGGLFGTLFPIIGAAQVGKLLYEMGEKVYEVGHKAAEANKLIGEAFSEQHQKAQVTIDDLDVQADKLQLNIDKLKGHPGDGLKLALDEARVYADKLQASLIGDRKELEALFKEHHVGTFGSLLSGVAATGTQEKQLLQDNKDVESKIDAANSAFNVETANAKSLDDIKKAGEKRDNAIRSAIQSTITTYRNESQRLRNEQTVSAKQAAEAIDFATRQGHTTAGITPIDNGAKIANVEGIAGKYQDFLNTFNGQLKVAALTEQEGKIKGDKESAQLAKESSRKSLEEQKQAAAAEKQQWDDDHAAWLAAGTRSAQDEVWFWINLANSVGTGSLNYVEASKKADEALKKVNDDRKKQLEEARKMQMEFSSIGQKGIFGVISSWGKGQSDAITSQKALEDAQANAKYSIAESGIQYDVAAGKLSKYDAAVQLQTLHTLRYNDALTDLQNKLAQVQGGPEGDAQRNGIQKQIVELNARRTTESMQDSAAVSQSTLAGALKAANQQWLSNTQNLAPQIVSVYTSVFSGFNDQLTNLITNQKTSWSSFFRGLASEFAKIGLGSLEGAAQGALGGLFGGKKQSSSLLPSAAAVASLAGGATPFGAVAGLFGGLFGGFHANGGDVDSGKVAVVGERGPELFMPHSSGSIVPNNRLGSMFGGGSQNHFYEINVPSGITPEQFHQSMAQIIPGVRKQAAQDAVKAIGEQSKRRSASSAR